MVVSVPPHFTSPAEREKPVPPRQAVRRRGPAARRGRAPRARRRRDHAARAHAAPERHVRGLQGHGRPGSGRRHRPVPGGAGPAPALLGRLRRGDGAGGDGLHRRGRRRLRDRTRRPRSPSTSPSASSPVSPAPRPSKMDAGPTIALGPNIHPRMFERLVAAAKAVELPYQVEPVPGDPAPTPGPSRSPDRASPRACSASRCAPCTPPWRRCRCATSSARGGCSPSSSCGSTTAFAGTLVVKDAFARPRRPPPRAGQGGSPMSALLRKLSEAFGVSGQRGRGPRHPRRGDPGQG